MNNGTEELHQKRKQIIEKLKEIYDPEILTNIYDLGLIYGVDVNNDNKAYILMTFTSPNCPAIQMIPDEIKESLGKLEFVKDVEIEITWEPAWNESMMTEEARLEAGIL